ncbi:MAG: MFS transporter [Burkholderiaceae bacterium]|nr:MFS transporter [Burkholderiaceae bacterium]
MNVENGKVKQHHAGILVMAISTALVTTYSASALNLAIPSMGAEFNSSASALGWIVSTYLFCSVCLSLPFGKIADVISRRAILLLGCVFYLVFSILAIFCTSMSAMLVMRVGQGMGAAMLFSTNIAILIDAFPSNQRGSVMGLYTAATYTGISIGPVLGGMLTDAFGWRSVFISMVLICFVALLASALFVPSKRKEAQYDQNSANHSGFRLDWAGMLCYIVSLVMLLYGLSTIGSSAWALPLMLIGMVGCVLFFLLEARVEDPLINVRVFAHNKNFLLSNLAAMFNYAATFAVCYLMSIYLQEVKGMNAWNAGLLMASQPVLQAIISPVSGRMSDRYSPFMLASAGMVVCTVALICFTFFSIDTPQVIIVGALLLTGVGCGLFSSPNQTAIMSSVEAKDYGIASSLIATSRNIGQVFCMALITLVTSLSLGGATLADASKAQIAGSFRMEFIIFSVICAIGVFISLQRKGKA